MRIPSATYRVQFNKDFRFEDALGLVPYLHQLGITDLYASPILRARAGSAHGYDQVEPTRLNPELGTEEDFRRLTDSLRRHDMGLLLDIVPNHMAASMDNPWWRNVLEHGRASPYAGFFDIQWVEGTDPNLQDRVLLPILGDHYAVVLEKQELRLELDDDGFYVRYWDNRLPVDPATYPSILEECEPALASDAPQSDHGALKRLLRAASALPPRSVTGPSRIRERQESVEALKTDLWRVYNGRPSVRACIDRALRTLNGKRGQPESFAALDRLLTSQPYRLSYWRTGAERLNYRRFFDVTSLAAMRIQSPRVFRAMHELLFRLAKEGRVTGFRIDHIDGLHDPLAYLRQLQRALGGDFYVVVEKILVGDEALPSDWPVAGTTGYDFLNYVNGALVDEKGVQALGDLYDQMLGESVLVADITFEQQKRVMQDLFQAEVRALASTLEQLAQDDRYARDFDAATLQNLIVEVAASLPVYRTYVRSSRVSRRDREHVERAIEDARRRETGLSDEALAFFRRVLLLETPPDCSRETRREWLRFVMRWQQFTGPVMAKGVEDTSLYVFNRLISLNEVGSDPPEIEASLGVAQFHRKNGLRARRWPHTLNATSTHDTKRSEDVRARINVLSEMPDEWGRRLMRWSGLNEELKWEMEGGPRPDANEEMLIYQTLVGCWPLHPEEDDDLEERLKAYIIKAGREAKVNTNWLSPNEEHEAALTGFIHGLLDERVSAEFLADFRQFHEAIAFHGALNSLSQALLKATSPGVPDFYQGSTLWDFSLVDPDNRRPVDFRRRFDLLDTVQGKDEPDGSRLVASLLQDWRSGAVKLYLTAGALRYRLQHPGVFSKGDYRPLQLSGPRRTNAIAFARGGRERPVIVVVPRLTSKITTPGRWPLGVGAWGETSLRLPQGAPAAWRNVLGGSVAKKQGQTGRLPLSEVFSDFPCALLEPV